MLSVLGFCGEAANGYNSLPEPRRFVPHENKAVAI